MDAICILCTENFIKNDRRQKFCSLICANRFNLNNKNKSILPSDYSSDLAELIGILLGDGSVTKYFVKVHLNRVADRGYEKYVVKLCKKLFGNKVITLRDVTNEGTNQIQISSIDVCDYLRGAGFDPKIRKIPSWIEENDDFTRACIRGLFDTEGSVGVKYFQGKNGLYIYKQLTFTNSNTHILQFIERCLRLYGYKPTRNSKTNIYISNRVDIARYQEEIGSSNPKMIRKLGDSYRGYGGVAERFKAAVLKTAIP